MGRQHTTWISDETWERLKDIPGGSTSEKLRNAVKFADPNEGMRARAIERQRDECLALLERVYDKLISGSSAGLIELLECNDWLWKQ